MIRSATAEDAAAIAAIYAPFVESSHTSFELIPPTAGEMAQRIQETQKTHPWLVLEEDGRVLGYAYASLHRTRAAYRYSCEVSVYVGAGSRRKGLGRALYRALFAVLARLGFHNAYAGITLPNPASVALHEAMGFIPVGIYKSIGFKHGAWHDVGWWQLALRPAVPPDREAPLAPSALSPEDLAALL